MIIDVQGILDAQGNVIGGEMFDSQPAQEENYTQTDPYQYPYQDGLAPEADGTQIPNLYPNETNNFSY